MIEEERQKDEGRRRRDRRRRIEEDSILIRAQCPRICNEENLERGST